MHVSRSAAISLFDCLKYIKLLIFNVFKIPTFYYLMLYYCYLWLMVEHTKTNILCFVVRLILNWQALLNDYILHKCFCFSFYPLFINNVLNIHIFMFVMSL